LKRLGFDCYVTMMSARWLECEYTYVSLKWSWDNYCCQSWSSSF